MFCSGWKDAMHRHRAGVYLPHEAHQHLWVVLEQHHAPLQEHWPTIEFLSIPFMPVPGNKLRHLSCGSVQVESSFPVLSRLCL